VTAFTLSADGTSGYYLDGNQLVRVNASSGASQVLDTQAANFRVVGSTVYEQTTGGVLQSFAPAAAAQAIDSNVASFVVAPDGIAYVLETDGKLYSINAGTKTLRDNATQSIAISTNGVLYDITSNGSCWMLNREGWTELDGGHILSIAVTLNGTFYEQGQGGSIWQLTNIGWTRVDREVTQMAVASDGVVVSLHSDGTFYGLDGHGYLRSLADNVRSFTMETGYLVQVTHTDNSTQPFNV
jgi:hypothetical protein